MSHLAGISLPSLLPCSTCAGSRGRSHIPTLCFPWNCPVVPGRCEVPVCSEVWQGHVPLPESLESKEMSEKNALVTLCCHGNGPGLCHQIRVWIRHCSHHLCCVSQAEISRRNLWCSYIPYLPKFLVWHFSTCSISLNFEWFLVDFVPLSAFGYIWNILILLLKPDLALQSFIQLSECRHPAQPVVSPALACPYLPDVPGKHPLVLDLFIILKVHTISGTGVRLRNLNTFCNSIIGRHWNKSPPWVGRFLILQYSVALKTVASEGCHFKRIYIWNFIKYISLMKSLVTCCGGKKEGDLAKDLRVLGIFSYQIFVTVQDVLKPPSSRKKGSQHRQQPVKIREWLKGFTKFFWAWKSFSYWSA